MRIFILLLLFLFSFSTYAQINEDFSDGNFTSNPVWSGDAGEFTINTSLQLQLNSSGTGISFLSSPLNLASLDSSEWRCYVRQNFAGSSSNNGKIYLASDQANLEGPLNGYYIQLGEALSNDAVELFRQTGTTSTSVARCTNGAIAGSFAIGIKVTRSAAALWKIYVDYGGGTNYLPEATGIDATFNSSSFFGVVCTYTSSNSTNFYFDNFFYGPIQVDSVAASPINAIAVSANQVDVYFSEALEASSAENEANYLSNNGLGVPALAVLDGANFSLVHLTFAVNIPQGVVNTLTISNIIDLNNNAMSASAAIDFVLPATPAANDILINEILFNPKPDEFDFVELYNNSTKIFDLKTIYLANTDSKDSIDSYEPITTEAKYFYPGEYLLLTENILSVVSRYTTDTSNYIQTDIPSYNDDEDGVVVVDNLFNRIDQFNYHEDYHYPLINNDYGVEGVSLERINFNRSTQDKTNWHSAASSVGYATPGYKNSQYNDGLGDGSELTIEPEIFSPDNDGYSDVVNFILNISENGYVINADIYNQDGRLIKQLARNRLLAPSDVLSWDGINDSNEKASVGIYILQAKAFNTTGDIKKFKKAFVLASKL